MLQWFISNSGIILGVLFGVSESLALIPSVKANSVFQAILNVLSALTSKNSGQ